MNAFERLESQVRSYSRRWPVVFDRASGSWLYAQDGRPYLDFFAGAGALNYGHNHPALKRALVEYVLRDGVTHALDMWTEARGDFLRALEEKILAPRKLHYKVAFPGPAGTNAVEAALKLTRKVTGKYSIAHFGNAFHGMTLGAMSVNGDPATRSNAGVPLPYSVELHYDSQQVAGSDIEGQIARSTGGLGGTAAVIVETVQGEGGINVASGAWLRELSSVCRQHRILLVVDDVQMGCGRTGPFFSFEEAGIVPDIVCLSKSISGYGLPLALLLIRPDLDVWKPGEHNGTFRGLNLAFVTGAEALRLYWSDDELHKGTLARGSLLAAGLNRIVQLYPETLLRVRGRGLVIGLETPSGEVADAISAAAFERGLLLETCGPQGEVVKFLPPLNTPASEIDRAVETLEMCVASCHALFS